MSARIRKLFENLQGTLINDPDEKEIQTKNFIRTLTEVDDGSDEILDKHIVVRLRHIPS